MVGSLLLEVYFPLIGVVLSNALYLAPAPAVAQAVRTGKLGSLNVLPLVLMVVSTTAWISYALSVPNPYITASNLPGAVAAVAYLVFTLPLMPREAAAERRTVQLIAVAGTAALLVLWSYLVLGGLAAEERSKALGFYGSLICVILFASPLSTMREVIAAKSSATIYAPLTLAQVANCATWTGYGFAIGDLWVWGPNLTGLLLGLMQLALKLVFPVRGGAAVERGRLVAKGVISTTKPSENISLLLAASLFARARHVYRRLNFHCMRRLGRRLGGGVAARLLQHLADRVLRACIGIGLPNFGRRCGRLLLDLWRRRRRRRRRRCSRRLGLLRRAFRPRLRIALRLRLRLN